LILLNGAGLETHVLAGVLNIFSREYDFEGGRTAIS
jgi:hypothetical protein